MKSIFTKVAGLAAAAALMAAPAWADAPSPNPGDDNSNAPAHSNRGGNPEFPGPKAPKSEQRKAYGKYCQDQSKKRSDAAPGTKGTPFSQCVRAMAKMAKAEKEKQDGSEDGDDGSSMNPKKACHALSKKRRDAAPGTKGTPFSQCVHAANQLRKDMREQEEENEQPQS